MTESRNGSTAYDIVKKYTAEKIGNNAKALEFYKEIKDQYPDTVEGIDIDKYITRIENAQ